MLAFARSVYRRSWGKRGAFTANGSFWNSSGESGNPFRYGADGGRRGARKKQNSNASRSVWKNDVSNLDAARRLFSVSFWEKVTAALFVAGRPTVSKWTLAGSSAGNRLFACRCKVGFFLDGEIEFWVALKIVKKVLTERNNYYF